MIRPSNLDTPISILHLVGYISSLDVDSRARYGLYDIYTN